MRTRTENNYRSGVTSKDGTVTVHMGKTTGERVTKYCANRNINRTKFVEQCVNERLDKLELEDEYLQILEKEELIVIIKGLQAAGGDNDDRR